MMKPKSILQTCIAAIFVFTGLHAEAKKTKKSEGYVVAARYFASDQEQFPRPKKVAQTKKFKKKMKRSR